MASVARTLSELRGALRRAGVAPPRPAHPACPACPACPEGVAATGLPAADELLAGGLPRGRLSELSGRRSAGRTALALAALAAATRRGEVVAYVDVGGALDVRRALAAGVDLDRLLWARAADARRGAQAADLVLNAGGFGLVVLDLGEAMPRLPDVSWLRLARGAERSGAALVVLSPPARAGQGVTGTFAALHLEAARARGPRFGGAAGGVRVLVALEARLSIVRARRGGEGGAADLVLRR